MRGICFIEPLFKDTASGRKIVTRRMNDLYNVGEVLFLKEPYRIEPDNVIKYKFSSLQPDKEKWSNKLFMKADYARYFIKITDKRREHLQEISEEDCILEGVREGKCGNELKWMKAFYAPGDNQPYLTARSAFEELIDRINGPGTWENNPVVTRYEFKLVDF